MRRFSQSPGENFSDVQLQAGINSDPLIFGDTECSPVIRLTATKNKFPLEVRVIKARPDPHASASDDSALYLRNKAPTSLLQLLNGQILREMPGINSCQFLKIWPNFGIDFLEFNGGQPVGKGQRVEDGLRCILTVV
jgi:hypothetical protein